MKTIFVRLIELFRSQSGVAAIEFAIIGPVFALLLFGCLTFFVVIEDGNRDETATYTVADVISRQTTVSESFLATVHAMFLKMLPASHTQVSFRVSSLKKASDKFSVDWSYPVSPLKALTNSEIPTSVLPLVANGDSLILVETSVGYAPLTAFGNLSPRSHSNIAANRPRFTSAVTKSD